MYIVSKGLGEHSMMQASKTHYMQLMQKLQNLKHSIGNSNLNWNFREKDIVNIMENFVIIDDGNTNTLIKLVDLGSRDIDVVLGKIEKLIKGGE